MKHFKSKKQELKQWRPEGDIVPLEPARIAFGRNNRREAIIEFSENLIALLKIEKEFLDLLFSDSDTPSYSSLYSAFKERWDIKTSTMTFNYSKLVEDYFTEMYKPQCQVK